MDCNENSHIKLTIEPCLCCVQVTIDCCGHVFLFYISVAIWPKELDPASSICEISRPALVPDKDPLKIHYEIHDIVPADL